MILSLLMPAALAQSAVEQGLDRPVLPFRSVAGEDGAHVLYQNPALLNFDRDAAYGVYYDTTFENGVNALTVATGGGGVGAGIGYKLFGEDQRTWWTISSGASIRLDDRLAFGTGLHWELPDGGDNNFVAWDLGLGWRPTPWLGFGGAVQNLGSPAPELDVFTHYTGGIALRPAGDIVTLGVDYGLDTPPEADAIRHVVGSLRLRPVRGLWLRLYGDQVLGGTAEVGGAVEIHLTDIGFGVDGRTNLETGTPGVGGYIVSVSDDDQLILPVKEIAEFSVGTGLPYQPRGSIFSGAPEGYLSFLKRLHDAASDPQVKGLLLHVEGDGYSYAQVEEIIGVIRTARANRKPVVAVLGEGASTRTYLLASACDRIYLHPAGGIDLVGLSAELQYFKGTLDLVGIGVQYAKRAEYKSAPEQWTETGGTGPAREEMNALLDDTFKVVVDVIAKGRGKTPEEVKVLIDGGPYTAKEALEKGLVDKLIYPDAVEDELKDVFDGPFLTEEDYHETPETSGWAPQRAVATIIVDGAISSGPSSSGGFFGGGGTGSETVVKALEQAADSRAVKAVVLRVDSPGGSAFASDEIWRAVEKVKDEGKPVIVSMGGYAASGGYYVSAGADKIYALPTTVTGSIGVYGGKFNGEKLFETLKVGTESYTRGRNAGMFSIGRPFDAVEYAALDRMIGDTYSQFKDRVGTGRGLNPEDVEAIARGRVWSGTAAMDHQLVDEMGGYFDAVDAARDAAGMSDRVPYSLVVYDPWVSGDSPLPARLVRAFTPHLTLPPELERLATYARLRDEHIFAILPYDMEVR